MEKKIAVLCFYAIALLIVMGTAYTGFVVHPNQINDVNILKAVITSTTMLLLLFMGLASMNYYLKQ